MTRNAWISSMAISAILWAIGTGTLLVYAESIKYGDPLERCQLTYSYDTCYTALNR